MSILSRKIVRRSALLTALGASLIPWPGCATARGKHDAFGPRLLTRVSREEIAVEVYGGLIDPAAQATSQSTWEKILFGPRSSGQRWLRTPQGLTSNGEQLWVCDQGYPDVLKVSLQNGAVHNSTARAHRPTAPVAATRDDTGNLYVVDAARRSVLAFSMDGQLAEELTGPAAQSAFEPSAVAVRGHTLFIADRANQAIARYDLANKSWSSPLVSTRGPSLVIPTGLAFTTDGVLLVTDGILGIIHRIDENGNSLEPFGRRGREQGQLMRPIGICTTPGGRIVVADAARQSVVIFDAAGQPVVDLHRGTDAWSGWTLPTGVACLAAMPQAMQDDVLQSRPGEWIVVSDMLGKCGLTVLHVVSEPNAAALHADSQ